MNATTKMAMMKKFRTALIPIAVLVLVLVAADHWSFAHAQNDKSKDAEYDWWSEKGKDAEYDSWSEKEISYDKESFDASSKGDSFNTNEKEDSKDGSVNKSGVDPDLAAWNVTGSQEVFRFAGFDRAYTKYIPHGDNAAGLIISLHGAGGNGVNHCIGSRMAETASLTGAVVLCPDAIDGCWKSFEDHGYCIEGGSKFGGLNEYPGDCPMDVDFLAALIEYNTDLLNIPDGKVIMSGFSNGGSMAHRFNCEKAELIGGLVVWGQAYLDPFVGLWDQNLNDGMGGVPSPTADSYVCKPSIKRPFVGGIGSEDLYYGRDYAAEGLDSIDTWKSFSRNVLGCSDKQSNLLPSLDQMEGATCRDWTNCAVTSPGVNVMCRLEDVGHEASPMSRLLVYAFRRFFNPDTETFEWITSDGLEESERYPSATCDPTGASSTEYYGYQL